MDRLPEGQMEYGHLRNKLPTSHAIPSLVSLV